MVKATSVSECPKAAAATPLAPFLYQRRYTYQQNSRKKTKLGMPIPKPAPRFIEDELVGSSVGSSVGAGVRVEEAGESEAVVSMAVIGERRSVVAVMVVVEGGGGSVTVVVGRVVFVTVVTYMVVVVKGTTTMLVTTARAPTVRRE